MKALSVTLRVVIVLVLAVVAQEYAVRLAVPAFDPANHLRFARAKDGLPALGVPGTTQRLIKNSGDYDVTVHFNRDGFRDSKDLRQAKPGDVFLVGDSFGFGWGVEQADRLSEQLQKLIGRRVFNLSVPTDIDGYARLLAFAAELGAPVHDVVLALNMTDDIHVYGKAPAAVKPETAPTVGRHVLSQLKEFLLGHSGLYFMTTHLVQQVGWLRDLLVNLNLIVPLDRLPPRDISPEAVTSTVNRLVQLAARYRLTILVIPYRGLWIGTDKERERRLNERVVTALREKGLSVVDMSAKQEAGGDPMTFHFPHDGHWNKSGHALAAHALAETLGGAQAAAKP